MAKQEFKYIRAGFKAGEPAHINFYDDVDSWSAKDFLYEFQYLENWVEPSEIIIHVNSSGGCVVDGMSVFSAIINSKYKTKTINDGLAASMGSIIWAAGTEVYMKDYALLMIHNPFSESDDESRKIIIKSFKKQLATIYSKRFGLTEEEANAIMDGEGKNDGTWYTATDAINAGFITESHIIETEQAIRNQIAAKINGVRDAKELANIMAAVKQNPCQQSKENNNNSNNQTQMANDITLVAAQLGFTGEKATEANVQARIKALLDKEALFDKKDSDLKTANATITSLNTKIAGNEATITNLTKSYNEAKAKLDTYEAAEAAAKTKSIENMVDDAIAKGKIDKGSRETWIRLANADFDTAKASLDSIPSIPNLNKEINDDPNNLHEAKDGLNEAEKEYAKKIEASVGKNFEFTKWQN